MSQEEFSFQRNQFLPHVPSPLQTILLEQLALRLKAKKKIFQASQLLFTKLNLEQATREIVSRHKAKKLAHFPVIADLCCGIGGDSFFLDNRIVGVDINPGILKLYDFNMRKLNKDFIAVCTDATRCNIRSQAALLDPARRQTAHSNTGWQDDSLSPALSQIEGCIKHYKNMGIKLRPGITVPEFLCDYELEYIGVKDECIELTVWTGDLGCSQRVTAVELESGSSISASISDIPDTFSHINYPGSYIFEPVKVLVRSHLFGVLANQLGLWQIDSQIAYLSGNEPVLHPFLKSYKIIGQYSLNLKGLKRVIKEHDIGILEIKKRGVAVSPEKVRKQLSPKGSQSGILIFTRVKNKKTVFLVQPFKRRACQEMESLI
ncbi:MAG: hypothetical protein HQK83_06470 [Fibrobacteria bacterium]|nr:hypothetical protein [Fibrobacteria bacterium]